MTASMNGRRSNGRSVCSRSSANRWATRRIVRASLGARRGSTVWWARRSTPAMNWSIASGAPPSSTSVAISGLSVTGMGDSFGSLRSDSGGGAQRRGLKDQLSRRPGMGNGDGVRGARDLDRAVGARAQGHVVLEGGGDVAVLLAEHEPRRALAPERALAGRRAEGLLRDRPLRGGHPSGLRRRHVRGELVAEPVNPDRKVGRAVAA